MKRVIKMKWLRNLTRYGIMALGIFGLSSCWGVSSCYDFRDNTLKKAEDSTIGNLPLEEVYIKAEADVDKDGDDDKIVVGKLKGKDKCRVYLFENNKGRYKPRIVMDNISRYPRALEQHLQNIGQGKSWLEVSIEKSRQVKDKYRLELRLGRAHYKKQLDMKK